MHPLAHVLAAGPTQLHIQNLGALTYGLAAIGPCHGSHSEKT